MAEGSEDKELVPRLLRFSGKADDWRMWSRKFLARAATKNYKNILIGMEMAPTAPIQGPPETTAEQKERMGKEEKFLKANHLAYVELLSAFFWWDQFQHCWWSKI